MLADCQHSRGPIYQNKIISSKHYIKYSLVVAKHLNVTTDIDMVFLALL
jgi:hypothetical protein